MDREAGGKGEVPLPMRCFWLIEMETTACDSGTSSSDFAKGSGRDRTDWTGGFV